MEPTCEDTGTHIPNLIHAWDLNNEEFTFTNIDDFCEFVLHRRR